jgi:hypothetical protein
MITYDNRSGSYQWLKHIHGTTALLYSLGSADMNSTQMTAVIQFCYTVVSDDLTSVCLVLYSPWELTFSHLGYGLRN